MWMWGAIPTFPTAAEAILIRKENEPGSADSRRRFGSPNGSHSLIDALLACVHSSSLSSTMASATPSVQSAVTVAQQPKGKKPPYPFYLGGVAATIAASITHPLDLTKVRLQASGDKRMIESIRKTVRTAGVRGLFDGISGTWLRQMSYSLCRFWAYDESKKILEAGPDSPPWILASAGVMGMSLVSTVPHHIDQRRDSWQYCGCSRKPRRNCYGLSSHTTRPVIM